MTDPDIIEALRDAHALVASKDQPTTYSIAADRLAELTVGRISVTQTDLESFALDVMEDYTRSDSASKDDVGWWAEQVAHQRFLGEDIDTVVPEGD